MKQILFSIACTLLFSFANAQISQEWAVRYNNWAQNGNDTAKAMVLDDSSNVYVTGSSAGTNGYMDYLTIKYSSSGTPIWSQRFNGAGNWHDNANAIAIDDSGNVYVTGTSFGGGSTPTNNYLTIKYSRNGVLQWVKEFDRAVNYDEATAITTDDSGYVYVTGFAVAATQEDFFTIKYDGNGNIIWTAAFDGTGHNLDRPERIALDSSYNVYVAGNSASLNVSFDFTTIKYNSSGVQQWANIHDGSMNTQDNLCDMKVTAGGTVYVTGVAVNTFSDDWTIIKYDTYGNQEWISTWGTSDSEGPFALALDGAENVYTTGVSSNSNYYGCVTMKHDSSGMQQWIRVYRNLCTDMGTGICADGQGYIYITGESPANINCQNIDYFLVKYDAAGTSLDSIRYNGLGNQNDKVTTILIDSLGSIYLTGGSYGGGTGNDYATVKYGYITHAQEIAGPANLSLVPNPGNGQFSVQTDQIEFQLMVYGSDGRLVASQQNNTNINITPEPDGVYFVYFYGADGTVSVQKLVKTSTE